MRIPRSYRALVVLALILILSGCGGGSGGVVVTPPTPEETPTVTIVSMSPSSGSEVTSPTGVSIRLFCSTTSNNALSVQVSSWGDSKPGSEWRTCSTNSSSPTVFEHTYSVDARSIMSIIIYTKLSSGTGRMGSAGASITVNPASPTPATNTPTLTSFGCDKTMMVEGEGTPCYGNVTCPSGACTCVLDCGDSTALQTNLSCNSAANTCSYPTISANDVTYYPLMYPTVTIGGTEYRGNARDTAIRVRKGSVNAPVAPSLSMNFERTLVGGVLTHLRLIKVANSTTYNLYGTIPTNCDKMYVMDEVGVERQVTSKSGTTWNDNTTTVQDWYSRDYYCKDASGNEGAHLTIEVKGDTVKPLVPTVYPVTTPVYSPTTTQRIRIQKQVSCILMRGTTAIAPASNDDRDDLYEEVYEDVTFTTSGSYSYTYYCKDAAGNQGNNADPVTIQYSTTSGGGGGGGGSTDPSGPQASFSVNPTFGGTSTNFVFSYACTSNCSNVTCAISYGDGSAGSNDPGCDGGSVNHTYSTNGTYTPQITISGDAGSNNFIQNVSVGTGSTNYATLFTSWLNGANGVTTDGSTYVYSIASSAKCLYRFTDTGGGVTSYCSQISNMTESFSNPIAVEHCPNGKLAVLDQGNRKVYLFGANDITGTPVISFLVGATSPNTLACGTIGGNTSIVVSDGNGKVYRYDASGSNIWISSDTYSLPTGIAIGQNDAIYLSELTNSRVLRLDSSNGNMADTTISGLSLPRDIATSGSSIYVAVAGASQISVHDTAGNNLGHFGGTAVADGSLGNISGIAVMSNKYYVSDSTNGKIVNYR